MRLQFCLYDFDLKYHSHKIYLQGCNCSTICNWKDNTKCSSKKYCASGLPMMEFKWLFNDIETFPCYFGQWRKQCISKCVRVLRLWKWETSFFILYNSIRVYLISIMLPYCFYYWILHVGLLKTHTHHMHT